MTVATWPASTSWSISCRPFRSKLTPEKAILKKVREAVLKGNKRNIVEYTKEALNTGLHPKQVLDEALLPGINEVGSLYDQGKYFLPQLIAGAEAMKLISGIS